jgi:hypothetical protein
VADRETNPFECRFRCYGRTFPVGTTRGGGRHEPRASEAGLLLFDESWCRGFAVETPASDEFRAFRLMIGSRSLRQQFGNTDVVVHHDR